MDGGVGEGVDGELIVVLDVVVALAVALTLTLCTKASYMYEAENYYLSRWILSTFIAWKVKKERKPIKLSQSPFMSRPVLFRLFLQTFTRK